MDQVFQPRSQFSDRRIDQMMWAFAMDLIVWIRNFPRDREVCLDGSSRVLQIIGVLQTRDRDGLLSWVQSERELSDGPRSRITRTKEFLSQVESLLINGRFDPEDYELRRGGGNPYEDPEVDQILIAILVKGMTRIRESPDASNLCFLESDHLHNVPDVLVTHYRQKLLHYAHFERRLYARKPLSSPELYESDWERLVELAGPPERRCVLDFSEEELEELKAQMALRAAEVARTRKEWKAAG